MSPFEPQICRHYLPACPFLHDQRVCEGKWSRGARVGALQCSSSVCVVVGELVCAKDGRRCSCVASTLNTRLATFSVCLHSHSSLFSALLGNGFLQMVLLGEMSRCASLFQAVAVLKKQKHDEIYDIKHRRVIGNRDPRQISIVGSLNEETFFPTANEPD